LKVMTFREPEKLMEEYLNKKTYSLPITVTRIKLPRSDVKGSHYCYIIEFGYDEAWIFDEATDYSGTGGRYFEEMEKFLGLLKGVPYVKYVEYEIPFEVYWKLYNLFYGLWRGEG